ncbi:hypothetical protein AQUCO_00900125v1 [Aquilegia coerulea]|uniref:C2H2-type domain-containing protein n=1 Tax=Aquilegia coerulea TaxID=218851 RepID=A0A2G5EC39_AQUCA|nr:hypothetical protein AQUCO_00900125v1 [Aquilegia coerulea]
MEARNPNHTSHSTQFTIVLDNQKLLEVGGSLSQVSRILTNGLENSNREVGHVMTPSLQLPSYSSNIVHYEVSTALGTFSSRALTQRGTPRSFCCKQCPTKFYTPQSLGGHQHAHINNQKMKDRRMRLQARTYHPYYHASRLRYRMDRPLTSHFPMFGSSHICHGGLQMQPGSWMHAPYYSILSPVRYGHIQVRLTESIGRNYSAIENVFANSHFSGGSQEISWGSRFNTSPRSQSLSDSFAGTNGFANSHSSSGSREMPGMPRFNNSPPTLAFNYSFAGMNGFAANRPSGGIVDLSRVSTFTNNTTYHTFADSSPRANDVDSTIGMELPPPPVSVVGFRPWASNHTSIQPLASKYLNINPRKPDGNLENTPRDPKPPEEDSAELDLTLRL